MKEHCDCKEYEICSICCLSKEQYRHSVKYWWNSDKRVSLEQASEWDKKALEND